MATATATPTSQAGAPAPVREARSDRIVMICNYTALGLFTLAVLYPLVSVVSASLSDPKNVVSGKVWLWPVGFSTEAFKAIFDYDSIVSGFSNSIVYAVGGALPATALTLLAAYPLSRKGSPGKGIVMALFVFTMMFTGGLIPTYLVVDRVGLLNTRWAMILPTAMAVWNMIITRTFFQSTIPEELVEAAKVDGCSDIAVILLILNIGSIMSVGFEKVLLLQNTLNLQTSEVLDTYVYKLGFASQVPQFSYAAAIGLFRSVIGLALLVLANTVARRFAKSSLW
ncbi:hypothetical protein ACIBG5_03005 [Kribbella sp. NPDC050241]|uniref:hypothetical protein n=1 Tax=Kribbella sp. NPDC050241 TaxID=3364115 RepID=UPI0037B72695